MEKKRGSIMIAIISLIIIIITIFIVILLTNEPSSDNKNELDFKKEYEFYNDEIVRGDLKYPTVNISKDNIIKYSNVKKLKEIFDNDKNAVIYIGYPSCLYCRTAIQVLLDTAEKTELDTIYYIDIEKIWFEMKLNSSDNALKTKKETEEYNQLVSLLDERFIKDYKILNDNFEYIDTGEDRLEVPLVLFITNGHISSYNIGTLPSQIDPLITFDKSQTEGLSSIYKSGIEDVLGIKHK